MHEYRCTISVMCEFVQRVSGFWLAPRVLPRRTHKDGPRDRAVTRRVEGSGTIRERQALPSEIICTQKIYFIKVQTCDYTSKLCILV